MQYKILWTPDPDFVKKTQVQQVHQVCQRILQQAIKNLRRPLPLEREKYPGILGNFLVFQRHQILH